MPKYAQLDQSVPPRVVGYYDTDLLDYPSIPEGLVELSDECWEKRTTELLWTIVDGKLQALPTELDADKLRKADAAAALADSDVTVLRCLEIGQRVPKVWRDYRDSLRAILRGQSDADLPVEPEKPAGL